MKGYKRLAVALAVVTALQLFPARENTIVTEAATTQQQITQTQKDKNELENKLDETHEDLEQLKGQRKTLKGELNHLNDKLSEVSDNLEELGRQIREKEQDIADTQAALKAAKEKEAWQYEMMVKRVRCMYERKEDNFLNALLGMGNLSDMLNTADFFEKIAAYEQKMLTEFKENRKFIEEEEKRLQEEMAELEALEIQAEAEKSKVSGLISQTSNAISKYSDQISDVEKKALEYEAEIKKKEEDLEYLKKKLKEEMAMSNAAENGTWRDISEVRFEDSDRYLLANLIYCEAGGEPDEGKLAVGSVVINRVLSSVYPDSVVGVIHQKNQFSPVGSGRLDLALASNRATESCYKAADQAMAGMTNVGNCVYFRTPVEGLSGIRIGGHIFY